jgi:hypothetical protein
MVPWFLPSPSRANVGKPNGHRRLASSRPRHRQPGPLRLGERPLPPGPRRQGRPRLVLVESLAATWEVQHPPEGSKVVACVLDLAH